MTCGFSQGCLVSLLWVFGEAEYHGREANMLTSWQLGSRESEKNAWEISPCPSDTLQTHRRKEIIKIRSEFNAMETKSTIQGINERKIGYLER